MKKVYKYELPLEDVATIHMPRGAKLLHVGVQGDVPHVWALVNPTAQKEARNFRVAGTGHPISNDVGDHIGSFMLRGGALVFHVFEF